MQYRDTWWFRALKRVIPNETISISGQPYLTRFFLTGKYRRVLGEHRHLFLHVFHTSDTGRELHDHPYTGTSLILAGGYREERRSVVDSECVLANPRPYTAESRVVSVRPVFGPVTVRDYRPGSINRLGLGDFHRTDLHDPKGAVTLFLTGKRKRDWGFLDQRDRFVANTDRRVHATGATRSRARSN